MQESRIQVKSGFFVFGENRFLIPFSIFAPSLKEWYGEKEFEEDLVGCLVGFYRV